MSLTSLIKVPYSLAVFTNFDINPITIRFWLFLIFGVWYNSNIIMSITNGKCYYSNSTILFCDHDADLMLKVCINICIMICTIYIVIVYSLGLLHLYGVLMEPLITTMRFNKNDSKIIQLEILVS